jgi:hypothetical protein
MLEGTEKLKVVMQALRREKLGRIPGRTIGSELDSHERLRVWGDNDLVTGKGSGGGLGGDRFEGTGLDLEVDADAVIEEKELVGSRNQNGIVGLEKLNAQND